MSYQALYRKWRPRTFDEVVGQRHITETLKNEVKLGRVTHAYIFCGSRGTGKTSTARILSRAINCLSPKDGNPCNECEICKGILEGRIMDVSEIDAASNNRVDDIRDLREETRYVAADAKYRVYIVDEVHMLSTGAFNALLKVLEEPPPHIKFILATTEVHKVPQTILSRCQRFDFRQISTEEIAGLLTKIAREDNLTDDRRALRLIAEKAEGSMRDALSLLDQCAAFLGGGFTYDSVSDFLGAVHLDIIRGLAAAIAEGDAGAALGSVAALSDEGKSVTQMIVSFIEFMRRLLILKAVGDNETDEKELEIAGRFTYERLVHIITLASEAQASARFMPPRVVWEIALVKMCLPVYDISVEGYAARLSELEEKLRSLSEGAFAAPPQKAKAPETALKEKPAEKESPADKEKQPQKAGGGEKKAKAGKGMAEIPPHQWQAVMDYCMGKKLMSLYSALSAATPKISDGALELCFDEQGADAYRRIIEANMEDLRGALTKTLGECGKIACTALFSENEDRLMSLLENGHAEEFEA